MRLCTRKIETNFRSPPRLALDLDVASLLLEEAADDAEPQACRRAILPRREERLEHPLQLLQCHTLPLVPNGQQDIVTRSEEPTSELQSPLRLSYAVFCL